MMARQSTVKAFFNQALAGSRDRVDTGCQRGGDLAVAPSLTRVRGVGFQQDACFQLLPRWVLSFPDHRVQLVPLVVAERHDVFFVMATRAPSATNRRAVARPIPLFPPVMRAVLFVSRIRYLPGWDAFEDYDHNPHR